MGYEAMREQTLARQKELGIVPADTELPPINPIGTPETRTGPGRQAVPGDGRDPPVGLAVRRRAAPLLADGRGLRRLPLPRRPPHRPAARLPRADRRAREHARDPRLRQRRERRGRPERLGQRDEVRQRHPRRHRRRTSRCSTSSAAPRPTTTTRTAGRWPSTRRSRCGSATSSTAAPATRASSPGRPARRRAARSATSTTTRSTSCRPILDVLGVEAPETIKGHVQSHFDGVSMRYSFDDAPRRRPGTTQFYSMLGSRGIWHDGWKAVTTHPTLERLEPLQRRRVGAVPRRRRPLRAAQPRGRAARTSCASW